MAVSGLKARPSQPAASPCALYVHMVSAAMCSPWASTWLSGEESVCQCRRYRRRGLDPWVGKMPCRGKWQPIPVFFPGKSQEEEPGGLQSMGSETIGNY